MPHEIHPNQDFFSPSWTPYRFSSYKGQPESSSLAHPTIPHSPYLMPYPSVWPRYGFGYSPYSVPPDCYHQCLLRCLLFARLYPRHHLQFPPIPLAMPTLPTTTPLVAPLPAPITSQNPIVPLVVVNEPCEESKALKAMIIDQISGLLTYNY